MSATATPPLTLYSARVCPWAQRATLAVEEVGAKVELVEIDLQNKPDWYASKVNPASKVPVLAVGDTKIPESLVVLELVADLYRDSDKSILPGTALERAEARYFIERFVQVAWGPLAGILFQGKEDVGPFFEGLKEVSELLGRHPGPFFLGDKISIADLGVAPFVGRIFSLSKHDVIKGDVYKRLTEGPEFKPLVDYNEALTSRPSWKATYDEKYIIETMAARLKK